MPPAAAADLRHSRHHLVLVLVLLPLLLLLQRQLGPRWTARHCQACRPPAATHAQGSDTNAKMHSQASRQPARSHPLRALLPPRSPAPAALGPAAHAGRLRPWHLGTHLPLLYTLRAILGVVSERSSLRLRTRWLTTVHSNATSMNSVKME
jgi:hypothetical protein